MAKGRLIRGTERGILICALPLVAHAHAAAQQASPPPAPPAAAAPATPTPPPTGPVTPPPAPDGSPVVDIIPLHAYVGGVPLRCGHIVPGSENVQLNGRTLTSGADYAMDYGSGVIYLLVSPSVGDSLVVSYRAASKSQAAAAPTPALGLTGLSALPFSFLPGAQAIVSMGVTDRASDGSVTSSNLYGLHNGLKFGQGGSLSGLFVLADQQRGNVQDGFALDSTTRPTSSDGSGKQRFLVQNFRNSLMGGTMSVDYQQVSKSFANFSAVRMSGYTDDQVAQLKAERGLTRTGLSFDGLKFGSLAVSNSIKEVGDGANHISWRSFGLQQGGFKLNYASQQVGENFNRFDDLADADKAQLAKERGLSRQNFTGEFDQKAGKLSFSSQSVTDDLIHSQAHKMDLAFTSKKYGFDFGREDAGSSFIRTSSLNAAESADWGREVGMKRQWLAFNAAMDSKSKPFTFDQLNVSGNGGAFVEKDAAYTGKTWSLQHIDMKSNAGFTGMTALQDADANNILKNVASHYGDKVVPSAGDKAAFLGGIGITRDYNAFTWQFKKDWGAKFDSDDFRGATDGGYYRDLSVTGKTLTAAFHEQKFGPNFTEAASLMPMEQARLGVLPGLKRRDFTFSDQFNKLTKLDFSTLEAEVPAGGAQRVQFHFTAKGIDVSGVERKVSPNFANVSQLVDPEAAVLGSLLGFDQRDLKANLTLLKNMKFTGEAQDARDEITGEIRSLRNATLDWALDKNTDSGYTINAQKDVEPLETLFDSETQQLWITHNFGRGGKFEYLHEFDVARSQASSLPDADKEYVSYETQISKSTSLKAEETMATYSSGQTQNVSAETLSTQLTKRAGVSFTEVQASSGPAGAQDPSKNNYGVWYDLGNGVRISYGYAHQMTNGADSASSNLTVAKNPTGPASNAYNTLQPGTLGPVTFAGGYGTSEQLTAPGLANHTQAFSNIALATVKPLKWGPVTNIKFNIGMDTAEDYSTWSKDNHSASFAGQLGAQTFGFDYKGQLAPQGTEGIDRAFHFQTDPSPKSRLSATLLYKVRTLPGEQNFIIRDFNITAIPAKNLELIDSLQTNPEVANSGVFLGSIPQAARSNKWSLDYHQGTDSTLGISYQELINESSALRTTTEGLNAKLFQKCGSPVTLFFGEEDDEGGGLPHRMNARYSLEFDQVPGPHQTLSMFLGNVSYNYYANPTPGFNRQNWTARMDYTLKF